MKRNMQEKKITKELMEKRAVSRNKMILAETACEELLSYGLWDVKTRAKKTVQKYLLRRLVAPEDLIFWPTGLLAAGLWYCRQEMTVRRIKIIGAPEESDACCEKIEGALSLYFKRWEKRKCPVFYVDDLLAGEVFLAIYAEYCKSKAENAMIRESNAEKFRMAVEKLAEYAFSYPTDETGSFFYRPNQGNGHVYVDVIGQACPFLYEYGRIYEKDEGMELAVKQIANFLAYGIDAATGLPYHGYNVATGMKYGIIGWGRAVGWLLRGLTGCMSTVYGAARLRESFSSLIDAALVWQRKDGYFSWQLQATEGPADTSATGMICAALQEGLRMKMLQGEVYQDALEKGVRAIQKSIRNGRVYDCSGECEGFSMYPQKYGDYPWALAAALLLD